MNAITWNFQGTSNKGFVPLIKDILKEYDVSLLFLLETHSSGPNVVRTIKRIWTEWVAFGGSLWSVRWDSSNWKVQVLRSSCYFVHGRLNAGTL